MPQKPYKPYVTALITAFVFLGAALVINYYAGTYATQSASNPVTDIILDNIPVFDVDGIFIWGSWLLVLCIGLACATKPSRLPFVVKSIALFVVIRSVFIILTHLAPFPTHVTIDPLSYANYFIFGADLFFSGHTGLPLLIALIFWDNIILRVSFMALSGIFAVVVLMGHLHYSIDVFAAFFITYAICGIAEQIFRKDKELGK